MSPLLSKVGKNGTKPLRNTAKAPPLPSLPWLIYLVISLSLCKMVSRAPVRLTEATELRLSTAPPPPMFSVYPQMSHIPHNSLEVAQSFLSSHKAHSSPATRTSHYYRFRGR